MLSKAQNKYIRSLSQQKFREEHGVFVAEGEKIASEWLKSTAVIKMIFVTGTWASDHSGILTCHPEAELYIVKDSELSAISSLKTANSILLVIPLPKPGVLATPRQWCLALDDVQDPGNMGTIIRIADWFGIKNIICSSGCADVYNPKVVQSAMGGHLRVAINTTDLVPFLRDAQLPVIAATIDGSNVYQSPRRDAGILVIGNESKGISPAIKAVATERVCIPRTGGAESLNAGVAAGILCALLLPC